MKQIKVVFEFADDSYDGAENSLFAALDEIVEYDDTGCLWGWYEDKEE